MQPCFGKRCPLWTASSPQTGLKWAWKGPVDLSTIFNGSTGCMAPAIRDGIALPAPSIVDEFSPLPELSYAGGSVGPPACHLARTAARALFVAMNEDAQNDSRHATTPGELTGAGTAAPWPSC